MPVPGQEFGDPPRRVVSDAGEQVGEIVLWIETVELGALDQGVDRSGAVAAGIGAGKQIILAANGDTAPSTLTASASFYRPLGRKSYNRHSCATTAPITSSL